MEKAVVKIYSKTELANLYERPVRTVMNWINGHKELMSDLENTGYRPTQKHFTIPQVKLIFQYLEAPYLNLKETVK